MPDPPDYVAADPLALTAWRTICARLYVWNDDASPDVIANLAMLAASHCRGRIARGGTRGRRRSNAAERAALRLECRKYMALLGLIDDARVPLAPLRPDGLDTDIAHLCGLPEA
jgi:hypothetical protein